jgi:RNA polymerase sigma-70 factor (ECF subfamily)
MSDEKTSELARAIEGDLDALTRLLEQYGSVVRQSIRDKIPRQLRSILSEDDVMQETYAEAYLSVRQLNAEAAFVAWLRRIARNNLLDAIRSFRADRRGRNHRRVTADGIESGAVSLLELLPDQGTTPSQAAMRREWADVLQEALLALPDAYRQVLQLYDLEGRSVSEVSALLQCSPGAVYMRRSRALRMLREALTGLSHYV